MTDSQITQEILRYIEDKSYDYAVLIDGEWGCGKTYFIKNSLIKDIVSHEARKESGRKIKYISLYGCKNIQDIQENLVWSVAEEAVDKIKESTKPENRGTVSQIANNILLSSRKIGNAVMKKFVPEADTYSIVSDWLIMNNYIFVFDDLERCDCPINEVFGLINGLVEHEGTKVILVANEKEISQGVDNGNYALEYLVALEKGIEWPKAEERGIFYNRSRNNTGLIKAQELENRRKWLFPAKDMAGNYKKIREKLIGVTLRYEPDVEQITLLMVQKLDIDEDDKELIIERVKNMKSVMDYYRHHNLRTFQFFLSKVIYLLERIRELSVTEEYVACIKASVIDECFRASVKYKANIKPGKWEQEISTTKDNPRFKSILSYVEKGEFAIEEYEADIEKYSEELSQSVMADDPFNLLYNQYYYHTQKWCEDNIDSMLQRLEGNKYPLYTYTKMVIILVRLQSYGFKEDYLLRAKKAMITNVQSSPAMIKVDNDLFFIEDSDLKRQIRETINEINQAIGSSEELARRKSVNEILHGENWVDELDKFINPSGNIYVDDMAIFCQASSDDWYSVFHAASPEQIDSFRHTLLELYPRDVVRKSAERDLPVIVEIIEKLKADEAEDLIKKACIGWLIYQFVEIVKAYGDDENPTKVLE